MRRHTIPLLALMPVVSHSVTAQYKSDAMFGVRAGVSVSKTTGVPTLFVSEDYYSGYSFTEGYTLRPAASLFFTYHIPGPPIGLEARLCYEQASSSTSYSDINGFSYTVATSHQTVGLTILFKGYAWRGLYAATGIGFAWNLTPGRLTYSSNSSALDWGDIVVPSDDETADEIKEAVCGNNNLFLPLSIGYEFPKGFCVDAFFHFGLNDVLTTLANRHDWIDNRNRLLSFGLTAGWALPTDKPGKRRAG